MVIRGSGRSGALFMLQLLTGIYLATLGLNGLLRYDSDLARLGRGISQAFGGGPDILTLVAAVVQLAGGVVLVVVLFVAVGDLLFRVLTFAVLAVWFLRIVMLLFVNSFLAPDLLTWLSQFSLHGIVAMSLWMFTVRQ